MGSPSRVKYNENVASRRPNPFTEIGEHLHEKRYRHDHGHVPRRHRHLDAIRHGRVERYQQRLHDNRADEAAGERTGCLTESGEHSCELLEPRADPFRVKGAQRT